MDIITHNEESKGRPENVSATPPRDETSSSKASSATHSPIKATSASVLQTPNTPTRVLFGGADEIWSPNHRSYSEMIRVQNPNPSVEAQQDSHSQSSNGLAMVLGSLVQQLSASSIPTFTGREDVDVWLQKLHSLRIFHRWNDQEYLSTARLALGGEAASWVDDNPQMTAREFESLVRKAFAKKDPYDARREFHKITQETGERVGLYVQRVRALARLCAPLPTEEEVITAFIAGLNPRYMKPFRGKSWSLNQAIEKAAEEERKNSYSEPAPLPKKVLVVENEDQHPRLDRVEESLCAMQEAIQALAVSLGGSRTGQEVRKCWNCDRTGHIARNCHQPRKERNMQGNRSIAQPAAVPKPAEQGKDKGAPREQGTGQP